MIIKVELITIVNTINRQMRAHASWYMRIKKTKRERAREVQYLSYIPELIYGLIHKV